MPAAGRGWGCVINTIYLGAIALCIHNGLKAVLYVLKPQKYFSWAYLQHETQSLALGS